MGKRSTVDVIADIRRAAYLHEAKGHPLKVVARMVGKSERTMSRWRKSVVWREFVELMREEG